MFSQLSGKCGLIACKRQCLCKAGVLNRLFSLKLLHSGPGRNPRFNDRGFKSAQRRVARRAADRKAKAQMLPHAAEAMAWQMQEAQMQKADQAQRTPDAFAIFNSCLGTDIADFMRFIFLFFCV